jgi:hypothetical protein
VCPHLISVHDKAAIENAGSTAIEVKLKSYILEEFLAGEPRRTARVNGADDDRDSRLDRHKAGDVLRTIRRSTEPHETDVEI